MRRIAFLFSLAFVFCGFAQAQFDPLAQPAPAGNALTDPGMSPSIQFLYGLDAKFSSETAQGGGAAFAKWFADDAVELANGKPLVSGHVAIAASATWTPAQYQLSWTPDGARMSAGGDMGFTWGQYEGRAKDHEGNPVITTGRYMTVWKKQSDGSWKVALEASNDAPPQKDDCCKLP